MSRQNWKAVRPLSLRDALDWCVRYAKAHNRSVEGVADIMGVNHWTLYKWLDKADLPLNRLKGFEHACGVDYASRWLVISGGKLVIDIPKGGKAGSHEIQALQTANNDAVGALLRFYQDLADVDTTLGAIQTSLEQSAWHKGNVEKYRQPELPFDEED